MVAHLLRRAAILFALKLFLSAYPHFHVGHLRLYGVLTRIALCYLAAGLICLVTRKAVYLSLVAATLLVAYWLLMRFVPVPGYGIPTRQVALLDPDGNLTAWIDRGVTAWLQRTIHTGSLYRRTNDPEGLLSTLPAIATTLLGVLAALCMRSAVWSPVRRRNCLALAGIAAVAAGELWSRTFPINKNLWTSSYVLLAGGLSLLALAAAYWLVDMLRLQERSATARGLLWPWLVFGSNAIVAFCLSGFLVETLIAIKVADGGRTLSIWGWIYLHGFARGHSTEVTSLAFAIAFVLLCFLPNWLLWRKQIFLRILKPRTMPPRPPLPAKYHQVRSVLPDRRVTNWLTTTYVPSSASSTRQGNSSASRSRSTLSSRWPRSPTAPPSSAAARPGPADPPCSSRTSKVIPAPVSS